MPERSLRKRRTDKRKTYWSAGAAEIWIFCRDLVKLEGSGALDEPVAQRVRPELRAIVDAALARARTAGGAIAPWTRAPEVDQMAAAGDELAVAIGGGKLKVHKKGVRASDVMALWPSSKKAGRPHSGGRAKLRFQMTTIILTEHRDEHYADNSVRSGNGCVGLPRTPHMFDLRKGLRSNYAAEILREALVAAESAISFLELRAVGVPDPIVEKAIANGKIAFLTKARPPSADGEEPLDLDLMRRNHQSWLKKGRPASVPKPVS